MVSKASSVGTPDLKRVIVALDFATENEASQMLEDEQLVRDASLGQVRTMLTYCIRSERMGPGQLAHFIRRGTVRHLLNRMKAFLDTNEL